MGMFTSCYDEFGVEHQIKCGYDQCEFLRLGQYVKSHIVGNYHRAGYLLDDIYSGCSYKNDPYDGDSIVIIKKCRLHAIIPHDKITGNEYKEFGIRRASKCHWSEEVFNKYRQERAKAKLEQEEYEKQMKPGLTFSQRMAVALIGPLRNQMNYSSIAKELFRSPTPEEIAEYERKQAIEAAKPVLNKYDTIKIISELKLSGKSPGHIEKLVCQTFHAIPFTDFLVYAYPEENDIDLVMSLYLNKEYQLFQCPLSTLVKGVEAVYQVLES
jgi:hypothetical protein